MTEEKKTNEGPKKGKIVLKEQVEMNLSIEYANERTREETHHTQKKNKRKERFV